MLIASDVFTTEHEADGNVAETGLDKPQPFEIKSEVDSSDITDHSRDDNARPVSSRRSRMKRKFHRKTHTEGNVYSCSQCMKSFSSQSSLRSHMNIHRGKYKCTECGKCCRDRSKLAVHRRSHSGEKPFECTVCSKRFTQSGSLVRHSRIHSGEKPYKCHMCDKAFSESGSLSRHTVSYTHLTLPTKRIV